MRINEIAPPGREKQVKTLKKKFDDKGAPYAIAWAQHNKHGKPKKNEGKMSDIDADIKTMSDAEFEKKYGKSKEQMKKDLNESVDPMRTDIDAKKELAQEIYNNNKEYQAIYPTWEAFMNSDDFDEENDRLRNKFEAPFGAVKKAMNTAKRVAGTIPGLGDLKDKAKGEKAIGDVANTIWKDFTQFKGSNPNKEQIIGWFQKNYQLDVQDYMKGNSIDQNQMMQAIQKGFAGSQSGVASTPDDAEDNDLKVQMSLLKKIAPDVEASPALRAIKTMASGKIVNPNLQQQILPIMKKVAVALTNPSKTQILQRALAESLSSSDLSKLDMLAREGMVPKNKVARFKTAMRTLAKGKDLPMSYKDDVIDVVTKLAKIITKPSVMGMVRKGLKENTDPKEMFDSWVKQGKEKHNI